MRCSATTYGVAATRPRPRLRRARHGGAVDIQQALRGSVRLARTIACLENSHRPIVHHARVWPSLL